MKNRIGLVALALLLSCSLASAQFGPTSGPSGQVKSVTTQYFTTSGTPTYTPNADLIYAIVECVGQGGGGGQVEGSASTAAGGAGGNGCVLVTEYNSQ